LWLFFKETEKTTNHGNKKKKRTESSQALGSSRRSWCSNIKELLLEESYQKQKDMANMAAFVSSDGGGVFMTPDRALIEAVFFEDASESMIKSLLECGADPNSRYGNLQHSCLHALAAANVTKKAELFLKHKANPNIKDSSGKTPLHIACQKGFKEYAALLLEHGADVNPQDHKGDAPLHTANKFGWTELAQLLVEKGADGELKNSEGIAAKNMPKDERLAAQALYYHQRTKA